MTKVTNYQINNPVKFRVYKAAAQSVSANVATTLAYDTRSFDTGSNVDITTNKGRFTAPVAGFYFLAAQVITNASTYHLMQFSKNGSIVSSGSIVTSSSGSMNGGITDILQLAAGDWIEVILTAGTAAISAAAGPVDNHFTGFLISTT
jgi:hypothetical protein